MFIRNALCCFPPSSDQVDQHEFDMPITAFDDNSGADAIIASTFVSKDAPLRGLSDELSESASQSHLASGSVTALATESDSRLRHYQITGGSNEHVAQMSSSTLMSNHGGAFLNQNSLDISAAKLSLAPSAQASAMLPAVPETYPAMDLTQVVSLIQELAAQSSNKSLMIPRAMALLCTKLNLTWSCLTAFSSTGQHYQHCGAAHALNQERLLLSHPGFLTCLENSSPSASSSEDHYSHTSCPLSQNLDGSLRPDSGASGDEAAREDVSEALRESSSYLKSTLPKPVCEVFSH